MDMNLERKLVEGLCEPNISEFSLDTELDLPNQRTITMDVIRTRSDFLTDNERVLLEKLLTFYCKNENVSYKQGMNEIFAPFLLLNRQGIPLHICYTCFKNFVAKFIPTLFVDDAFKPLSGLFVITKLILKYHLPEISTCFSNNEITPDIYMTTWYVTMFSIKIKDLNLLYIFWNNLIERNDILYISYFGIALLEFFKQEIQAQEIMNFPNVFKKIFIERFETLQTVLRNADRIKENLPFTAEMILKKYNMFSLEKTDTFVRILEGFLCLLILPREILYQTYPHDMACKCGNPRSCKNKRLNFLLIDCRTTKEQKSGYFINSHLLSENILKNNDKLLKYYKELETYKKNTHIALMGSAVNDREDKVVQQLFENLILNKFPYVSIVDGGYPACHEFAQLHELRIESHKVKKCICCDNGIDKKNVETTLDNFFRIGTASKQSIPNISEDFISSEKIFKCKVSESQDFEESVLGLIVTATLLILYNIRRRETVKTFEINKLTKITSNKNDSTILSFTFTGSSSKQIFILKSEEVKEFLGKVRSSFQTLKKEEQDAEKNNSKG